MLGKLASESPVIRQAFDEASQVLGYDLWQLCQQGPAEELNATEKTQPAMLVAGIATWRLWQERQGAQPVLVSLPNSGPFPIPANRCPRPLVRFHIMPLPEPTNHTLA